MEVVLFSPDLGVDKSPPTTNSDHSGLLGPVLSSCPAAMSTAVITRWAWTPFRDFHAFFSMNWWDGEAEPQSPPLVQGRSHFISSDAPASLSCGAFLEQCHFLIFCYGFCFTPKTIQRSCTTFWHWARGVWRWVLCPDFLCFSSKKDTANALHVFAAILEWSCEQVWTGLKDTLHSLSKMQGVL